MTNYKEMAVHVGLVLAGRDGIESVTLQNVADVLNTTRQAIGHHYSIDTLREAVERYAIAEGFLPVMAQAVTGPRSARYRITADQLAAVSRWIVGGRA
jgi:hypothetical protein